MSFPFEVPFKQVQANLDMYVDEVIGSLQSEFLTLPKGPGFVDYPAFEQGYEALKRTTSPTSTGGSAVFGGPRPISVMNSRHRPREMRNSHE